MEKVCALNGLNAEQRQKIHNNFDAIMDNCHNSLRHGLLLFASQQDLTAKELKRINNDIKEIMKEL